MSKQQPVKLAAKWTPDCDGKKDYDGDILSVSTRYWPEDGGFWVMTDERGLRKNDVLAKPSAVCSLLLWDGAEGTREETDSINLIKQEFEGETFEDVAVQVETWAQAQTDRAVAALRREFASPEPQPLSEREQEIRGRVDRLRALLQLGENIEALCNDYERLADVFNEARLRLSAGRDRAAPRRDPDA